MDTESTGGPEAFVVIASDIDQGVICNVLGAFSSYDNAQEYLDYLTSRGIWPSAGIVHLAIDRFQEIRHEKHWRVEIVDDVVDELTGSKISGYARAISLDLDIGDRQPLYEEGIIYRRKEVKLIADPHPATPTSWTRFATQHHWEVLRIADSEEEAIAEAQAYVDSYRGLYLAHAEMIRTPQKLDYPEDEWEDEYSW